MIELQPIDRYNYIHRIQIRSPSKKFYCLTGGDSSSSSSRPSQGYYCYENYLRITLFSIYSGCIILPSKATSAPPRLVISFYRKQRTLPRPPIDDVAHQPLQSATTGSTRAAPSSESSQSNSNNSVSGADLSVRIRKSSRAKAE
jgi:hypothetical protein